jgi:hypothetical protein
MEALCFHKMKHHGPIMKNLLLVTREDINFKGEKEMLQNVTMNWI